MKPINIAIDNELREAVPERHIQEPQDDSKEILSVHANIQLRGSDEFGKQLDTLTEKAEKLTAALQEIASFKIFN